MSFLAPHDLAFLSPAWIVSAFVGLAIGYVAGLAHFRTLKGVARRLAAGEMSAVFLQLGRLALLGGLLFLLALWGAQVLLPGAAGVLLARRRVLAQAEAET